MSRGDIHLMAQKKYPELTTLTVQRTKKEMSRIWTETQFRSQIDGLNLEGKEIGDETFNIRSWFQFDLCPILVSDMVSILELI